MWHTTPRSLSPTPFPLPRQHQLSPQKPMIDDITPNLILLALRILHNRQIQHTWPRDLKVKLLSLMIVLRHLHRLKGVLDAGDVGVVDGADHQVREDLEEVVQGDQE